MRSKQSACRRSSPRATRATSPGCGGTKTSGSTRVTWTWAAYDTSTGSVPAAARNASVSNCAPSYRLRTRSTTPKYWTDPPPGSAVSTTIASSSCTRLPSSTPTQNSSGVASRDPSTSPTRSLTTAPSATWHLPSNERLDAPSRQTRVAQPAAKLHLQGPDGQQVLGRPRIPCARRGEWRQRSRGRVREPPCLLEAHRLRDLQSHDPRQVRVSR